MKISLHRTYKINTGNYESIDIGASVELQDTEVGMSTDDFSVAEVTASLLDSADAALATLLTPALEHAKHLAKANNPKSLAFKVDLE